ncbi:MAG: 5'-methylthioadenosine/S-adenosylhomocysteine nucleosidase [Devosia sp.]|nr:5'-methylthioadenosine/S-adenosylhomocysteine nucleosidase [Devosia sp.]
MAAHPRTADLLYVMALDHEYGPHLRSRINPVMTGVGPVEAAVTVTLALERLRAQGKLPHYVVSLGSAGSARLAQAGVYQASSVSYRDMDASPLGFEPGVTPFLGLEATLPLAPLVPGLATASLSTGASIVSGGAYAGIAADMVDMETYAVLRACQRFEVPLIAIRGISDGDSELGRLEDWTRYLHVIDERLAHAVDVLEAAVASHQLG